MGDASDVERLLRAYEITKHAAAEAEKLALASKKGAVWKPFAAMIITFIGTAGGGAFAAGRYFESAQGKLDKIDELVKDAQTLRDKIRDDGQHQKDQIKEAYDLALDAKGIAVLQCHRIDGMRNERLCP